MDFFILICLLSATICSADTIVSSEDANHLVSPRAADEALEALSQDLFHFLSLSVQLDVQQRMEQGPVDVQSLADRLSDLGVSFRQLDEQRVADLEAQLTAIGTGVDTECSAGCSLPSEITDGLKVIETLKTKEAEIQAAYDASDSGTQVGGGGKVLQIEKGLKSINTMITGAAFSEALKIIKNVMAFKTPVKAAIEKERLSTLRDFFGEVRKLQEIHRKLETASDDVNTVTQADMSAQIAIVSMFKNIHSISGQFDSKKAALDSFKQTSAVFAAKLERILGLIHQNMSDQILGNWKMLQKLNVGSKFLNYFDNSFTASKWLKKLLSGNEDLRLEALKRRLRNVKSIGERLEPLRRSVENVNTLKTHQTLLDITTLLERTSSFLPELSQSTSELSECVKDLDLIHFPVDVPYLIDSLSNPEVHLREFKESLTNFITDTAADWTYLKKMGDDFAKNDARMLDRFKKGKEVRMLKESLDKIQASVLQIDVKQGERWVSRVKVDSLTTMFRDWISKSKIQESLKCLKKTKSLESMNRGVELLQEVIKLGKSAVSNAEATKVANDINAAIDVWKQLAVPQTRRRRSPPQSTPMDELIESTQSVRRLIRACTKDTLATLIQGVPQLDPNVKSTFQNVMKACDELKTKVGSVQKVIDLTHLFVVLTPLGDTDIDAGKLADELELALTTSDPAVLQAVQDLKLLDLKFVKYDGAKVGQALSGLSVLFHASLVPKPYKHKTPTTTSQPFGTLEILGCVAMGATVVFGVGVIAYVCIDERKISDKKKEKIEKKIKEDTEEKQGEKIHGKKKDKASTKN